MTSDDYGAFLNALEAPRRSETSEIEPAKNSQEFYEEKMATDPGSSSLIRLGEPGNYYYARMGEESPLPLHFISISDAELYSKWKEVALMPLPDTISQRDRLLRTSTSTFQIQKAPDGTSGHQSMVEEVITSTNSEIIGGILGIIAVGFGIRECILHSRAYERSRERLEQNVGIASLQEKYHDPTEKLKNLMNISQKIGDHPVPDPVGTDSSSNPLNKNHQSQGLLEGHMVTPVTQERDTTRYRLTDTGWEKRSQSGAGNGLEGQWEKTDHFEKDYLGEGTRKVALAEELLLHKNVDAIVIQNHNYSDGIANKIESYQKRLKAAGTQQTQKEIEKFTNLISTLETDFLTANRKYQGLIIGHLANSATSHDPKIVALQRLSRISEAIKLDERLDERPNKIEVLAEKLEHDYTQLATYQERVQVLQREIDQKAEPMDRLLEAMDHLLKAITHQSKLIKARVARATLIRPPYETLSEEQQTKLSFNKWLCIEKEALARSEELKAQKFSLSIFNNNRDYLDEAAKAFQHVAEEAQKPNPNQQRIDRLIQSANLYQQLVSLFQQASEAQFANQNEKAMYLYSAGCALSKAAWEAQKPNSNPETFNPETFNPETSKQIIDLYTQAASMFQLAAEAIAAGQGKKAKYLHDAGNALFDAAREAQKPNSNLETSKQIIYLRTQLASLFQQAAEETQNPNSETSQQIIDLCVKSAVLFNSAVFKEDLGLNKEAAYLKKAAAAFCWAALEAQKLIPNQERILQYVKEAEDCQMRAESLDCKMRAESLDQACIIS
jgi:hypothetical protein